MDESVRIKELITDSIEQMFNQRVKEVGGLEIKTKRVARGVVVLNIGQLPPIMVRISQLT